MLRYEDYAGTGSDERGLRTETGGRRWGSAETGGLSAEIEEATMATNGPNERAKSLANAVLFSGDKFRF